MDSSYLRAMASQLETTAKALRQMAEWQDTAQASMALNCDVLNKPLKSVLNLNTRCRRALIGGGVLTVGDLIRNTPEDLLCMRDIGLTSLNFVRDELAKHGLSLRDEFLRDSEDLCDKKL